MNESTVVGVYLKQIHFKNCTNFYIKRIKKHEKKTIHTTEESLALADNSITESNKRFLGHHVMSKTGKISNQDIAYHASAA